MATKKKPTKKAPAKAGAKDQKAKKRVPVELTITTTIGAPGGTRITGMQRLDEPEKRNTGKSLDQIPPGSFNEQVKRDEIFQFFVKQEATTHLRNWLRTQNGAFVWKAWRCLMHLDEVPAEFQGFINKYFDKCALAIAEASSPDEIAQAFQLSNPRGGRGKGNSSTQGQQADYWFWVDYRTMTRTDSETDKPRMSDAEAYRALAQRYETTEGAAKQRVLRIRKAGQYANKSRTW